MNKKKILQILLAASTFAGGMSLAQEKVGATEVKDNSSNNMDNTQVIDMARSILKGQVINAPTSLRVRADAGTNYSVLGYLANGSNFNIKAEKGDWYRIDFNGRDGYVHKDYVKILGSSSDSSTSTSGQKGEVVNASIGLNVRQSANTGSAVIGTLNNGDNFEIIAKSGVWYNIKTGSLVGYVHGDYVKVLSDNTSTTPPTTNPSTPETNEIIAKGKVVNVPTNLRVRSQPNTSSSILGYLLQGNEVQITGESGSWYKIDFNNKVGYVHKDYVQKIETSTPEVTPPVTNPEVSKKGQVINASVGLNIRQSASTSSAVVGSLSNGATFEILGKSGSWYNIKAGSTVGYVHGDYVKEIDESTTTPPEVTPPVTNPEVGKKGQVINASVGLNIRQSASTSSAVVGSLSNGATFEILGKNGSWYNIKADSTVGYIHGDYVKEIDESTTTPPEVTPPVTNPEVGKKGQVINASVGLNIRQSASTSSAVVGSLSNGATFEILGKNGSWYNIKAGSTMGYVHGDYVKEIDESTTTPPEITPPVTNPEVGKKGQVINTSVGLNIRKSASISSAVVGSLKSGDVFDIISKSGDWYNIKFGSITGFVHKDYVKEVSDDTSTTNPEIPTWENKKGQVIPMSSNLRVRAEANTNSEVLGYLLSGDTVTITGESNDWYKISFNGKTGYVHSDYIRIIDGNSEGDPSTQSKFETILNAMKAHLGSPYVWGGAGEMLTTSLLRELKSWYPNETAAGMYSRADQYADKGYRAFDCSGLMQWGFRQAGVYIGRSTWDQIGNGREVHLSDIKPGDLLFYSNLQHVGMYIGNGQWIEAPNKNADVRIMNVPWSLVGRARRILE